MSLSETVETFPQYKSLSSPLQVGLNDDAESDLTSLSSSSGSREHTPEPSKHAEASTTLGDEKLGQVNDSVFGSPEQRRIVNTYGRRGRSKSFTSRSGPASTVTTPRSSPRKAIPSTSPLTPLSSSPSKSPRKRVMIDYSPESPSKRRRLREALPNTSSTPSPRRNVNLEHNGHLSSSSRARKSTRTDTANRSAALPPSSSLTIPSRHYKEEWKLDSIGKLVWVRINEQGKVPNVKPSQITYWWPGKLDKQSSSGSPLRVTLFCPPSFAINGIVEVEKPSFHNITSHATPLGQLQFTSSTFTESSDPTARCPSDTRTSWDSAVRSLKREDMNADTDEFPSLLSTVLLSTVPSRRLPTKSRKSSITLEQLSTENESLTIPGEPVLARDNGYKSKEYWPARLEEYKGPADTSTKGKYRAIFLNGEEAWITRDKFFLSHEDGFGTCKMGAWNSKVKQTETDTEERERIRWEILGDERARSPEPSIPPPSNFSALPMDEQFAYLKPVLKCILNGQFEPAKQRHEGFIKGGTERLNVTKAAGIRGDLGEHTIDVLSAHICRWALRDDTFISRPPGGSAPAGLQAQGTESMDDASSVIATELPPPSPSVPPSSLPTSISGELLDSNIDVIDQVEGLRELAEDFNSARKQRQSGCEDFEKLSKRDKMEYCLNVLLPEAVIQLLLWRAEKRTALGVMSDAEERVLHEQGMKYASTVDFVHTIKLLRNLKEQMLARREGVNVTPQVASSGGTRSRPKLVTA